MNTGDLTTLFESILGVVPGTLAVDGGGSDIEYLSGARTNPRPKLPIVEDGLLAALAQARGPLLQKWYWPDAAPFCASLSHDVDEVRWSWRRRLLMAARHPGTLREPNTRYWNFDRVTALEQRAGVRSSWYFVADGAHPRDPPYRLSDVADVMRELERKGNEVGVHGSYLSYRDGAALKRERDAVGAALGHSVAGVRQHFINFEPGLTWKFQEMAGFSYDATLALNESSGFRTGLCHPYVPLGQSILEIPLILMDGQLFRYEGLRVAGAIASCEQTATEVIARSGLLTMNWHQHTYDGYSFPGYWDVYEHMVEWLGQKGARFMTDGEIWRWWTQRASVQIADAVERGGEACWTLTAPVDVRGLAVRVIGPRPRALSADVHHRIVERGGDRFLVLPELKAGVGAKVFAEP